MAKGGDSERKASPADRLPIPGPGRNSTYRPEFNDQVRKLCLLRATDVEIADFFGISPTTLYDWQKKFPAFAESVKAGKIIADAEVADSTYRRAVGEEIVVEKAIKRDDGSYEIMRLKQFVPGDVQAQRLWLHNRRRQGWSDKQTLEHVGPDGGPIQTEDVSARDVLLGRIAGLADRMRPAGGDSKPE